MTKETDMPPLYYEDHLFRKEEDKVFDLFFSSLLIFSGCLKLIKYCLH